MKSGHKFHYLFIKIIKRINSSDIFSLSDQLFDEMPKNTSLLVANSFICELQFMYCIHV